MARAFDEPDALSISTTAVAVCEEHFAASSEIAVRVIAETPSPTTRPTCLPSPPVPRPLPPAARAVS
jgi:hypothetical protein